MLDGAKTVAIDVTNGLVHYGAHAAKAKQPSDSIGFDAIRDEKDENKAFWIESDRIVLDRMEQSMSP